MRGDEERFSKLSERLSEEIEKLPKDGKDHELIIKIKGDHGNINLGTQSFDIQTSKQPPPPGSDRERVCPQCGKPTWRYTQLCMHCDYDLHRHDAIEEERLAAERVKANSNFMLRVFFVFAVAGAISLFMKDYLPASWSAWAIGVTAISWFIAFAILQSVR